MRNYRILLILILSLSLLLGGAAYAEETASVPATGSSEVEQDKVLAVVNDIPITEAMLQAYAPTRAWELGDVSSSESRRRLIQELIDETLLFQEAKRLGLADEPETAARLELGRIETLATAAVREFLEKQGPTEADIQKEYEETAPAFASREYLISQIQVDSETEAEMLIEKLRQGADFRELARAHSTAGSAADGGILDYFSPNQIQISFGFTPHVHGGGEVELPILYDHPIKTGYGWQVIRIDDIRVGRQPSLEGVRSMIVRILENRIYRDYVRRLQEQAEIDVRLSP